jgi:hypothetical protein
MNTMIFPFIHRVDLLNLWGAVVLLFHSGSHVLLSLYSWCNLES